ncbi:hypothetical protein PVAND_006389 [Polypedilum vanderplanki]|uniref:Uncharacterized protein n=1 Tax=Polypedilum vanderplanki TaxID=319348 RepID=A0A9J6C3T3_POLVA|nr:hypothetical protein PVAND_006389 [Polypedilum vanderplanki]
MVLRDICGISLEVIGQIIGWRKQANSPVTTLCIRSFFVNSRHRSKRLSISYIRLDFVHDQDFWSIINILGCITTSQVLFGLQFISFSFSINNVGTNIFSNLIELGMYVFCGMVIHSLREIIEINKSL